MENMILGTIAQTAPLLSFLALVSSLWCTHPFPYGAPGFGQPLACLAMCLTSMHTKYPQIPTFPINGTLQ
jgi:hypothetical protein